MASRLDEIKRIIEEMPDDPFPRYGLAMEHKNSGDLSAAHAAFADLQQRHPGYVPQFLMHGQTLIAMREPEQAAEVLRQGIAAAEKARNLHALGELRAALENLERGPDEDD